MALFGAESLARQRLVPNITQSRECVAKIVRLDYILTRNISHLQGAHRMSPAHITGTDEHIEIRKIFCVGLNYSEHVKEMKAALPQAPVFFLKPATAVIGDGGTTIRPDISRELHHEVEMTVLIGAGGRNIAREAAFKHVAGYGVGLDMTLRDIQGDAKKRGLPWTLSKGFDTSAPISKFVQATTISNPHDLEIALAVNGMQRQHASTGNLIFKVDYLIWYLSQFFTLERGDILFTGTPEGVAATVPGDRLEARLISPGSGVLASLGIRIQ